MDFRNKIYQTSATSAIVVASAHDPHQDAFIQLRSSTRLTSIILQVLMRNGAAQDEQMIMSLLRGLLTSRGHNNSGFWFTTHDNFWAAISIHTFSQLHQPPTPDSSTTQPSAGAADWWVTDTTSSEENPTTVHASGRHIHLLPETEATTKVPIGDLLQSDEEDVCRTVTMKSHDTGSSYPLYYTIGVEAYSDLNGVDHPPSKPVAAGMELSRSLYLGSGNQEATPLVGHRDENGVETFKVPLGSTVQVKLHASTHFDRKHVALVSPHCGGFESSDNTSGHSWWSSIQKTDTGVEVFRECFPATTTGSVAGGGERGGAWEYSYWVNATTAGTFMLPPATIEEMYNPDVYSSTPSAVVVVG
eukprot:TRINITY_DN64115_c0_g1_i1.p1 TRINITY_DN64115_c0_g1~~TRINITY_DN64115_c0_g1_i1.p1  ORF type:complete len:359 (+),score=78.42 TRINITY_DN64115_c0_g1_i1:149-1225(+)